MSATHGNDGFQARPVYVAARTTTYTAPDLRRGSKPLGTDGYCRHLHPAQATQAWTPQPVPATGPTYNWTTPPSTTSYYASDQ